MESGGDGVISLTVVGTVGYVFIRKDAIIENVKGKIMESIMFGGLGTGALEGLAVEDYLYHHHLILWHHQKLPQQNQCYH